MANTPAEQMADDVAHEVNQLLHKALDVEGPCETACPHTVLDSYTALGIANMVRRRVLHIETTGRR